MMCLLAGRPCANMLAMMRLSITLHTMDNAVLGRLFPRDYLLNEDALFAARVACILHTVPRNVYTRVVCAEVRKDNCSSALVSQTADNYPHTNEACFTQVVRRIDLHLILKFVFGHSWCLMSQNKKWPQSISCSIT